MLRQVMAVAAGLAAWFLVVAIASPIVRALWPEYVRVAATMQFTLGMKLGRLAIGAVATIAAGWTTAVVARRRSTAVATGIVLLVVFVPDHVHLWNQFPIWYHLTFLLSLVPLCALGARLTAVRAR